MGTRAEVERLTAIVTLIAESMGIDLDEAFTLPDPDPATAEQPAADESEKAPERATDSAEGGPTPVGPDPVEPAPEPAPVPDEPETAAEEKEAETR